jgi:hypothetical protein
VTSRDFCYWLQGCLEMGQIKTMTEEQVNILKAHLNLVFVHEIDPSFQPTTEIMSQEAFDAYKKKLDEVHKPQPQGTAGTTPGYDPTKIQARC